MPSVQIVRANDPRSSKYRWTVSSKGPDDAFVTLRCTDVGVSTAEDPLGKTVAEIAIPREVLGMLTMAMIYDDMLATEGRQP